MALELINYFSFQYPDIWALDEKDPFMQPEGGESVADVVSRLTNALVNMESQFRGYLLCFYLQNLSCQVGSRYVN